MQYTVNHLRYMTGEELAYVRYDVNKQLEWRERRLNEITKNWFRWNGPQDRRKALTNHTKTYREALLARCYLEDRIKLDEKYCKSVTKIEKATQ